MSDKIQIKFVWPTKKLSKNVIDPFIDLRVSNTFFNNTQNFPQITADNYYRSLN